MHAITVKVKFLQIDQLIKALGYSSVEVIVLQAQVFQPQTISHLVWYDTRKHVEMYAESL